MGPRNLTPAKQICKSYLEKERPLAARDGLFDRYARRAGPAPSAHNSARTAAMLFMLLDDEVIRHPCDVVTNHPR
jgi:hypothetical protein